jgi:hypothetical protein
MHTVAEMARGRRLNVTITKLDHGCLSFLATSLVKITEPWHRNLAASRASV